MLCLSGCAIPAPVVMTLGAPALLDCHVSTATGEVQLRSTSTRSKAVQLHFRAAMGSIPAQALLAPLPGIEQQAAGGTGTDRLEGSSLEAAAEEAGTEPAAPGKQKFARRTGHLIKNRHRQPRFRQPFGYHKTRRPRTDDCRFARHGFIPRSL